MFLLVSSCFWSFVVGDCFLVWPLCAFFLRVFAFVFCFGCFVLCCVVLFLCIFSSLSFLTCVLFLLWLFCCLCYLGFLFYWISQVFSRCFVSVLLVLWTLFSGCFLSRDSLCCGLLAEEFGVLRYVQVVLGVPVFGFVHLYIRFVGFCFEGFIYLHSQLNPTPKQRKSRLNPKNTLGKEGKLTNHQKTQRKP